MSSRAFAAVKTWLERGEGLALTTGARAVLLVLADECDDQGEAFTCEVSEEALTRILGGGVSTMRRHLGALEDEGVIARERAREPDGTWGGYRTALSLEKLGAEKLHRSNRAVGAGPVGKPVDNAAATTAQSTAHSTAQIEQPPPNLSGPKEGLPACLLNYAWPSEEHGRWAARILSVAGPGLADPSTDVRVLGFLAGALDGWMAVFSLEDDIVPVVSKAFPRRRPRGALIDISQITPEIWAHRETRKRAERTGQATAAGGSLPAMGRPDLRGLSLTIAAMEEALARDRDCDDILLHPDDRRLTGAPRRAAEQRVLADLKARREAWAGEQAA